MNHSILRTRVALLGVAIACIACGSDTTGPVRGSSPNTYWTLQLNAHAVTLAAVAPFNTIRLIATPRDASGAPLTGMGRVVYQAMDGFVRVDSTGLVTAIQHRDQTGVIASLQDSAHDITRADTVIIQVTDTVAQFPFATLSIQPLPADMDSAKVAVDAGFFAAPTLPVYATDAAGDSICSADLGCAIPVHFTSSNPSVATIDPASGQVTTYQVGHVTFYVSSTVYGVSRMDSLPFEIGNRIFVFANQLSVQNFTNTPPQAFSPQTLTIGVGGSVGILGLNEKVIDTVDITFDNPNAVTGTAGDSTGSPIVNSSFLLTTFNRIFSGKTIVGSNNAILTFPNKGPFTYHSRRLKASGTIIVSD